MDTPTATGLPRPGSLQPPPPIYLRAEPRGGGGLKVVNRVELVTELDFLI